MIISVDQTKSNFRNEFNVSVKDECILAAKTSWISSVFSSQLFDKDNRLVFSTKFEPINSLVQGMPFKWLWGTQLNQIRKILDADGNIIGELAIEIVGFGKSRYKVSYDNYSIYCYDISKGREKYILLFIDDVQIGIVTKSLVVTDNKDKYQVHLLNKFDYLHKIISLFVIYYDNINYGNQGEIVAYKKEYQFEWSFSHYNDLYDKDWLYDNIEKGNI